MLSTVAPLLERLARLLGSDNTQRGRMLGGFVDSLLQMFENCRPGLSDETLRAGGDGVEGFFVELYEKEQPRLLEIIRQQERHLSQQAQQDLFERVDERIRKVVIPAYVRLATRFTPRERNDFYLTPDSLHGLERLAWCVAGIGIGAFVVWAPFIPLWEKEWILPFAVAGLFFPNIRRLLALRRYQAELNALVVRTDNEIWRMDLAYLTDDISAEAAGQEPEEQTALEARLEAAARTGPQPGAAPKRRAREGGR